jgi:hypothetical protein
MKTSFLFLVLPFVAAVSDSAKELSENLVVDLLDATGEGPLVLADLEGRNRVQPAYCYGTKNFNCYRYVSSPHVSRFMVGWCLT